MKWTKKDITTKLPIKSWCEIIEPEALQQAINLSNHPVVKNHVALMPDCHVGYGMPIGGVIAVEDAIIPNAVGVDIGCGMVAVETNLDAKMFLDKGKIRKILALVKQEVPVGEGHAHKNKQNWDGFPSYLESLGKKKFPGWFNEQVWNLAHKNLGTLGGGNHFIELQKSDAGKIWLMLHSGSRNLGFQIANFYHRSAKIQNEKFGMKIPNKDLAYLLEDMNLGREYIRDMNFALSYAYENRQRMLNVFKKSVQEIHHDVKFQKEVNIHHNYAAFEKHNNQKVWVHRKGATSAKKDEIGIIPGSMGTSSYIVKGLGNPESFMSCSHGAGRVMGRMEACRRLSIDECNEAMDGIVFDSWQKLSKWGRKQKKEKLYDFGESPLAYKNIDEVIQSELDLIEPIVKLQPLGVIKG